METSFKLLRDWLGVRTVITSAQFLERVSAHAHASTDAYILLHESACAQVSSTQIACKHQYGLLCVIYP